jgi:hypothetical protein
MTGMLATREDFDIVDERRIRELAMQYEVREDLDIYRYVPPGPVAGAYIRKLKGSTFIMGPVGSGKTTASAFKRIVAASAAPIAWHPEDGKPTRMCRWIVLRDSFRSAEKTVLESWKQWFPKTYPGSSWAGGNDRPVTHTLRFRGADGVRVEAITEFAGLGDASIETLMKGREYSGGWLNEFDTHAPGALEDMEQRVGRYPSSDSLLSIPELEELSRELGRVLQSGQRMALVIGDLNAPTLDNHAYKTLVTNIHKTPDRTFFRQPSGLSDEAENRHKLEPDYYDRLVRNQEESFVMRMVENKFGYSKSGKPVYEGFDRNRHVARREIGFDPDLELIVAIDASMNTLNPAATLLQIKAPGRIAFIDELYLGHGVGAARFGEALKQLLDERYSGAVKIRVFVDPAAQYGADREGGQLTALETIAIILGLPLLIPAGGSNELGARLDAVKAELRGYLEPNTHLICCPVRCPLLIEGFEGKYRYKRRPERASAEYEDAPEKNHPHSDIHDSAQYGIQGVRGRAGSLRSAAGLDRAPGSGKPSGWGKPAGGARGGGGRGGFDVHRVGRR